MKSAAAHDQPNLLGNRTAAATYLATMSGDLAVMARRHGLQTLGYLLDMARLEAEAAVRQGGKSAER